MASAAGLILPDGSERALAPEFTIGRADDNDLTIEKPTVSRHHAVVSEEGDRWFLEDRGSFNGTFLNGQRIQAGAKVPLRHGDRIGLGAESVVFSAPESLVDPEVTTALQTGPPAHDPPALPVPASGGRGALLGLARRRLARRAADERGDRSAARDARRNGDREGRPAAGVRQGGADRGLAVLEAPCALQDRAATRLDLSEEASSSRAVPGSRLHPLTRITNKHLLPVFDRPMSRTRSRRSFAQGWTS